MNTRLRLPGGRVLLVDSITQLNPADAADHGVWAVSGSHGGVSSAGYALALPLAGAVFNDAGIGKDEAGIAALALLQARGTPACTVAYTSARIGDAKDTWASGVISRVNAAAAALAFAPGQPLQQVVLELVQGRLQHKS